MQEYNIFLHTRITCLNFIIYISFFLNKKLYWLMQWKLFKQTKCLSPFIYFHKIPKHRTRECLKFHVLPYEPFQRRALSVFTNTGKIPLLSASVCKCHVYQKSNRRCLKYNEINFEALEKIQKISRLLHRFI